MDGWCGRGPRAGIPCTDHEGNEYKSLSAMCRKWGITAPTFLKRRENGMSLEQALTAPKRKGPGRACTDHKGNQYQSLQDMFRAYDTNYTVYHYRHEVMGWSQKDALETPISDSDMAGAHACMDHLGNEFPSKKAMCEFWHVPRNVFFTRVKAGKSLKECLDPSTTGRKFNSRQSNKVRDHLGQEHYNLDAMCAAWNITKSAYMINIRNGLPLDRALTERTSRPKKPKDHTGQEHESINAMCRAWGVTKTTLRARLELGWTLEAILTHPEDNSHLIRCKDHLGNEYPSQRAMLAAWNVTYATFKHRQKRGLSLQDCLDPGSLHMTPYEDHQGHKFPCLAAMLDYWCVHVPNWHSRAKDKGMATEQALTLMTRNAELPGGIVIGKAYGDKWYRIHTPHGDAVLDTGAIIGLARKYRLEEAVLSETLPDGMRVKRISDSWFQVWGTSGTGPAPGIIMSASDAWLECCLKKYEPKPKKSVQIPSGRRRGAANESKH